MRSSLDEVCVKCVGVSYWTLLVERFVLPQLRCRTQPTDACSETTNMWVHLFFRQPMVCTDSMTVPMCAYGHLGEV